MPGRYDFTNTLVYLKILFVHTDDFEINLFKEATGQWKHKILTATSREKMLTILQAEQDALSPVDLLITEYKLPGIDGFKLIKNARKHDPGIFCMLFTKYDLQTVLSGLIADNLVIDGLMQKAESMDKLHYFICTVLEEKKKRMQKEFVLK